MTTKSSSYFLEPTLRKLFPTSLISVGHNGREITNLSIDTVPQGVVLGSAMHKSKTNHVFHIVDCNNERFFIHICQAAPGEGYDAFAIIPNHAEMGSARADAMLNHYNEAVANGFICAIPKSIPPTIKNSAEFVKHVELRKSENTLTL